MKAEHKCADRWFLEPIVPWLLDSITGHVLWAHPSAKEIEAFGVISWWMPPTSSWGAVSSIG